MVCALNLVPHERPDWAGSSHHKASAIQSFPRHSAMIAKSQIIFEVEAGKVLPKFARRDGQTLHWFWDRVG